MNPMILILLAMTALRSVAAMTKNTKDDKIAEIAQEAMNTLMARGGKFNVWTALELVLGVARQAAAASTQTGDDKLVAELKVVVDALERVVGSEVYRTQYAEIEVDWGYLLAPGQFAAQSEAPPEATQPDGPPEG